jgi:hypothetical protein
MSAGGQPDAGKTCWQWRAAARELRPAIGLAIAADRGVRSNPAASSDHP